MCSAEGSFNRLTCLSETNTPAPSPPSPPAGGGKDDKNAPPPFIQKWAWVFGVAAAAVTIISTIVLYRRRMQAAVVHEHAGALQEEAAQLQILVLKKQLSETEAGGQMMRPSFALGKVVPVEAEDAPEA